jgi:hypothetical protein
MGNDEAAATQEHKVRFTSPAPSDRRNAPSLSINEEETDSPAAFKRTMYAGHTPFPKRNGSSADEEDDEQDAGFSNNDKSGTATEEVEEEEVEEESSMWPWLIGGAAVVALGAGAAYMLSQRRR